MKLYFFTIPLICLFFSCKNDFKSNQKNTEEVGNIFFSKIDLTSEEKKQVNYVKNFNLYNDDFLSLHFDLEQPLLQSLKELAPALSEDDLLQKGNFQFSFLVDGQTIYVENLNTGAGTNRQKKEELNKEVRLVTPKQIGFWGWFMWQRFMKLKGGHDVLTEGKHTLSIEIKPYLQNEHLIVGPLLAKGEITVEVPKIVIDENLGTRIK